ncbi:MAG: hypothetical protein ACI4KR_00755 [Ruminiclostridium sp.]
MVTILSDSQKDYHSFAAEALDNAAKFNVKGMAMIFLLEDGQALTGYWNMDITDKLNVENQVRFDCIDNFIKANIENYRDYEPDGNSEE